MMDSSCRPCLDGLPVEVVETIAAYLDMNDLCGLRLISKEITTKSSQGSFKSYFRHKKINVDSTEQLQNFHHLTRSNALGCLVEELSLFRLTGSGSDHILDSNKALLNDSFTNLKLNSFHGCLSGLSLEIWTSDADGKHVPPARTAWHTTWQIASFLYRETMSALQESNLTLKRLTIFGDPINCSLACDQLPSSLDQITPSTSLIGLESLTLSLTHSLSWTQETDTLATASERHERIFSLLGLCPNLQHLNLHWFNTFAKTNSPSLQLTHERNFFDALAPILNFPHLKTLTLRGIHCAASSLQSFLNNSPSLTHIDLNEIHLSEDHFRPIFTTLRTRNLDYLHLDDLYEEAGVISFPSQPGKAHTFRAGRNWPNEITRHRSDTRKPIKYEIVRGRTKGSAMNLIYMNKRKQLYGPIESR